MNSLDELHQEMRECRRCTAAGYSITPGAIFTGTVGARVMVIGQAPGVTEVAAKRPFNAGSGRRLFEWLGEAGWDEDEFRQQHYMTAVTKCYPGKSASGRGDRVPSRQEQALCRPFLNLEIEFINPRLIIPVGNLAIRLFFPNSARLNETIGRAAFFRPESLVGTANFDLSKAQMFDAFEAGRSKDGRWLVPLPHPSGASVWPNDPENKKLITRAIQILGQIRVAWRL